MPAFNVCSLLQHVSAHMFASCQLLKIYNILSLVTSKAPLALARAVRLTNTLRDDETDFPLFVEVVSKPACNGIHREQRWCVSSCSKTLPAPSSILFHWNEWNNVWVWYTMVDRTRQWFVLRLRLLQAGCFCQTAWARFHVKIHDVPKQHGGPCRYCLPQFRLGVCTCTSYKEFVWPLWSSEVCWPTY